MSEATQNHRAETLWDLREPDEAARQGLVTSLGLSELVASLLVNRGVTDTEVAERFLNPRLTHMPDPFLLKDMQRAVDRVMQAMAAEESICVWGDYDVDGVTSASQLICYFKAVGVTARYFVPDRFRDGYGLNADRIRELAESGVQLLITVDCGISNVAENADFEMLQPCCLLPPLAAGCSNQLLDLCRYRV